MTTHYAPYLYTNDDQQMFFTFCGRKGEMTGTLSEVSCQICVFDALSHAMEFKPERVPELREAYIKLVEASYLKAMKADMIPEAWSGLWFVSRLTTTTETKTTRGNQACIVPPGTYTFLRILTDATMYDEFPGEVVMEDSEYELRTHLKFVMEARGKVLVTGLGLGCVTRGLLANPLVKHVTVIEKSQDVLRLVYPAMSHFDRLEVIEADALEWTSKTSEVFDYGWHDIWSDREAGEPHLDEFHTSLLVNCKDKVKNQGAWAYDERLKKIMLKNGLSWIG